MPIINQVVKGGGTTPTEKYPLFSRVKDDTNTNIGTVAGYFIDGNNKKYAVVALDNGSISGKIYSINQNVAGLTKYPGMDRWHAKETATYENNCYITAATKDGNTTMCSDARLLSYTIDGTTYYGQIPNILEMMMLAVYNDAILNDNSQPVVDISQGLQSTTNSGSSNSSIGYSLVLRTNGVPAAMSATDSNRPNHAHAILEIPIN